MKKVLLFAAFVLLIPCRNVSAQIGRPKAGPFSVKSGQMKAMLVKLFPDDPQAAAIEIKVFNELNGSSLPNISADRNCRCAISVTESLLARLGDRTDIAFTVAHEFGHIKLRHGSRKAEVSWTEVREDYGFLERQEIAADHFAAQALERYGMDVCPTLLGRLAKEFGIDKADDPQSAIIMKRVSLQRVYCYNKGKINAVGA